MAHSIPPSSPCATARTTICSNPLTPEDIKASVRKGLSKRRKATRRRQLLTRIEASVRELTASAETLVCQSDAQVDNSPAPQETQLEADGLVIDLRQHRVTYQNREIALTPIEYNTLVALIRARGRVQSYASIVQHTHGYECSEQEARTLIKTHISHLRQKITDHTHNPAPSPTYAAWATCGPTSPSPRSAEAALASTRERTDQIPHPDRRPGRRVCRPWSPKLFDDARRHLSASQ